MAIRSACCEHAPDNAHMNVGSLGMGMGLLCLSGNDRHIAAVAAVELHT